MLPLLFPDLSQCVDLPFTARRKGLVPRKENPVARILTRVNGMIPVILPQRDLWLFH